MTSRSRLLRLSLRTTLPALIAALAALVAAGGCATHNTDASVEQAAAKVLASQGQMPAPAPAPAAEKPAPPRPAAGPSKTAAPAATAAQSVGSAVPAPAATETNAGNRPTAAPAGFIDPITRTGDRVKVTLDECLRRTLANNLGIQIARFGPPIAHTTVVEAEALFDPTWFLNSAVGRVKQQSPNAFIGTNTLIEKTWTMATGLQDRLITGANVQIMQNWTWLRANSPFIASPNPQFDNNLTLSVTQPLLRGAGVEVNTAPIVLAKLDETISVADFKLAVMDIILQVESTYWDLVVAETQVQAISEALAAAQENLRISQRRFEEGKDKRVVVSLAKSAVTSRQTDLVVARLHLAQTSDRLKRLINDPDLPLAQPIVLAAAEPPLAEPLPVGTRLLENSLAAGLLFRPEITQIDARLSQADLKERVAKNGTLPQLDFVGSYNLNGLGTRLGPAFDKEFSTVFFDWSAGINFSVPIGNRGPQAVYQRSRLIQSQTVRTREDVRQQVTLDVSEAVRNLASAEEAILSTRDAREAAEQTLKDEESFVSAGAALLKDLLDAQRELADAKVREAQAMAAYMVGLAALERAKGTLLDYNNINVLDLPARQPAAPAPRK